MVDHIGCAAPPQLLALTGLVGPSVLVSEFASQPVWGIPSGPVTGSQCQQGPAPRQRARSSKVTIGRLSAIIRNLIISSCHGVPRGLGASLAILGIGIW